MTPRQKLKWAVLAKMAGWDEDGEAPEYPCPDVDERYDLLAGVAARYDAERELREGEVETEIPREVAYHYENKSVAMRMPDGSWVGWTYWYGGGKHGNPEEIEWMENAYDLNCQEEEKVVLVRTFSKSGTGA